MAAATLPRPSSEEERALYVTWLTEARLAYRSLIMGNQARVYVDQNGERVEYDKTSASALAAWIAALENALDTALANYRRPRPIGFTF